MIPLRYRKQLPPYWYDNEVAETHFETTGGEIDYQKDRSKDISNQFLLPYATWGLGFWDWMYFGEKQQGGFTERRERIRRKNVAKAKFTLATLRSLATHAGMLDRIREDFQKKKIIFEFSDKDPVYAVDLEKDFNVIRPVHVTSHEIQVNHTSEPIVISSRSHYFEVDYPICGMFTAVDDMEGRIFSGTLQMTALERHHDIDYPTTNTFYATSE